MIVNLPAKKPCSLCGIDSPNGYCGGVGCACACHLPARMLQFHKRATDHFDDYLKRYTDMGATREAAALNYVREFPARLPLLLLAMRAQF